MKLSDFIRGNLERLLEEWEKSADVIFDGSAENIDRAALRDHAKNMMEFIADNIDEPESKEQQVRKSRGQGRGNESSAAKRHGVERMKLGLSLDQVVTEHRALRASVTKLWGNEQDGLQAGDIDELIRFNEAVDQILSEAVSSYSFEKEKQTRLFEAMLSSSPDQSFILDPDGTFIYANRAAGEMFGIPASKLVGMRIGKMNIPDAAELHEMLRSVAGTREPHRGEMSVRSSAGEDMTYEYVYAPVLNEDGKVDAIAAVSRDITERKAAEHQAWLNANFDHLTGVPNRRLFLDRLEQGLKDTERGGNFLALLFIDLDRFKESNDRLGHDGGDILLRQVAERICSCVREADTVARLGGDEFTVILKMTGKSQEAEVVGAKILSEVDRPYLIQEMTVHISGSIGIAVFPRDGATAGELIRNADQAMYAAKTSGGNRLVFCSRDMQ